MGKKQTRDRKTDFAMKSIKNFKIILTKKGLFSDIQKYREKWNIAIKIDEPIIELHEEVPEPIAVDFYEELFARPEIKEIMNKLIKKRKKPSADIKNKSDNKKLKNINSLMKKYKIDSIYFIIFRDFINTGKICSDRFITSQRTGACFITTTDADGDPCMAIRIFPETTTKDIVAEWPEIKLYRDRFLGYQLPKQSERINIDRDLRIMQLKYCDKNAKEIQVQINKEFPNDTAFTYADVNDVIYKIKQLHSHKK